MADVHLDTLFAGASPQLGPLRRRQLESAFDRALALARRREVDALCIAGDLYEREHAGPDRGAFLRRRFAEIAPIRVFVSPGNHDPYTAASLYRLMEPAPENVTIFHTRRFAPVKLADGLTLWGAGHERERDMDPILDDLVCEGGGTHLLLFHGSDRERVPPHKECIAPFTQADIERTGAAHAMVGHFHGMLQGKRYAYSGSLEPLNRAQDGRHTASLVTIEDGRVGLEFIEVNATNYVDAELDLSPYSDRAALSEALAHALAATVTKPGEIFCRIFLVGKGQRTLDLRVAELTEDFASAYPGFELVDRSVSFDLDAIAAEGHTVRAAFVKALTQARPLSLDPAMADKALHYGLLAFADRELRP